MDTRNAPIGAYELVVFDWDGTILDTTAAITRALQFACRSCGLPEPSDETARSIIGLDWRAGLAVAAPGLVPSQHEAFLDAYVKEYRAREGEVALFPGIRLLIERLRASGVKLAVATGKSRRGLNRILEATGLGPFFLDTQTADENPGKPDPGMLESIHAVLGVSPELTVMVGDTTHDLYMAKAWGCRGVGVAYGAMSAEMLERASPAAICRDVPSLARLLGVDLD